MAARLGVTQAYVSLMEKGRRPVSERAARHVARLLRLPASVLPFRQRRGFAKNPTDRRVEQGLVRLGYPGFTYLRKRG